MKNNTLKEVQADIEGMDILKDKLCESNGEQMMTNDDTRDIAIRCVDRLVSEGYVKDCVDTDDTTEFSVQDIIHEEINKALTDKFCGNCGKSEYAHLHRFSATHCDNFTEDETCSTCDQHPYSDTDNMCPVCGKPVVSHFGCEIK
jgi:hypothetical protein